MDRASTASTSGYLMSLLEIVDFVAANWPEIAKESAAAAALWMSLVSLRRTKKLQRQVDFDKQHDAFIEEREERRQRLSPKFVAIESAVDAAGQLFAAGPATASKTINELVIRALSLVQVMPESTDLEVSTQLEVGHARELDMLKRGLQLAIVDVSRFADRRGTDTYSHRMEIYTRVLQLVSGRLRHLASLYGLSRPSPKVDVVKAIRDLCEDVDDIGVIENSVVTQEQAAKPRHTAIGQRSMFKRRRKRPRAKA